MSTNINMEDGKVFINDKLISEGVYQVSCDITRKCKKLIISKGGSDERTSKVCGDCDCKKPRD